MDPHRDARNWRLCTKHRTNGEPCRAPAMAGQQVCQAHGGSSPQARAAARLRIAQLVEPAIGTLARIMVDKDASAMARLRAAENVLDRGGYGRGAEVPPDEAREMLYQLLTAARAPKEDQDDVE